MATEVCMDDLMNRVDFRGRDDKDVFKIGYKSYFTLTFFAFKYVFISHISMKHSGCLFMSFILHMLCHL